MGFDTTGGALYHNIVAGGGELRAGYSGGGEPSAKEEETARALRAYTASNAAKAKLATIRKIADALKAAGIPVDPEAPYDAIAAKLREVIPHPGRNGKTFSGDAAKQQAVCRKVAAVLNQAFTPGAREARDRLIDDSLPAAEVCSQVAEIVDSFSCGIHGEFLAVHASVKNALRNVKILDEVMAQAFAKYRAAAEKDAAPGFGREADPVLALFQRAQAERRRQEVALAGILNVQLAPAAIELEAAMRDEAAEHALIRKLGLAPGTTAFGDALARSMSGLGALSAVAATAHKALKEAGISADKYLAAGSLRELDAELEAAKDAKSSSAELAAFLEAAQTLRETFADTRAGAARAALERGDNVGGLAATEGGAEADDDDVNTTPLARRLKKTRTERRLVIRDFVRRLAGQHADLLAAVKGLAPHLGKDIPLSRHTDALRERLAALNDAAFGGERVELALIGRYADAAARARKDHYLSRLRAVSQACEDLAALELYRAAAPRFAKLKAAVDAVEHTVDHYAGLLAKSALGAPAVQVAGGAPGDDEDTTDAQYMPELARSTVSLKDAVAEFAYFYYVARVRENLVATSGELAGYEKGYTALLGDAVAARLNGLEKDRERILATISDYKSDKFINPVDDGVAVKIVGVFPWRNNAAAITGNESKALAAAKKLINDEFDMKTRFYKALQAVDLYLKAFTSAVVKDVDALMDIKKTLDGIQIVGRWFNEETGDNLWKAFECGKYADFGNAPNANINKTLSVVDKKTDDHYYAKFSNAAALPAVPELGVALTDQSDGKPTFEAAQKYVNDAVDSFQALKNLVNTFARLGDKFGGASLQTQVFMSHAQIYKTLHDFIKQSAMSLNAAATFRKFTVKQFSDGCSIFANDAASAGAAVGAFEVGFEYVGKDDADALFAGQSFAVENKYFAMIVKAMAAKILVVLGVYDMFDRRTPITTLTPTRAIIGGALGGGAPPAVLADAAELYFRLPRLAEFYRKFLRWDGSTDGLIASNTMKIAMIPELDGVFAGLINLVFVKAVAPEEGDYSENEMIMLITEINAIYEHFKAKGGDNVCRAAITAFVMEINRRFGLVRKDDMKAYFKMVKRDEFVGTPADANDTNYAILPDEDLDEPTRPAPSDRYGAGTSAEAKAADPFKGRTKLDFLGADNEANVVGLGARNLLRAFRGDLEKDGVVDNFRSYALLIQEAGKEIARTSGAEAKVKVAFRLLRNTGTAAGGDVGAALMFHETVVTGLNTLCAVEAMVTAFDRNHCLEIVVADILYKIAIDGAVVGVIADGNAMRDQIVNDLPVGWVHDNIAPNNSGTYGTNAHLYGTVRYLLQQIQATGAARFTDDRLPSTSKVEWGTVASLDDIKKSLKSDENMNDDNAVLLSYLSSAARVIVAEMFGASKLIHLIENVFAFSSQAHGLVEVTTTSDSTPSIHLSTARLRELCENLFADVKYFFEVLRPFVQKDVVEWYEKNIAWVDENLIEKRIRGATDGSTLSLDGIARKVGKSFRDLVHVAAGKNVTGLVTAAAADKDGLLNQFSKFTDKFFKHDCGYAVATMIFYNSNANNSGISVGKFGTQETETNPLANLIKSERPKQNPAGTDPKFPVLGRAADRSLREGNYVVSMYSAGKITTGNSLVIAFNQLVAHYLMTLMDSAAGNKIYLNLVNSFANGAYSQAVSSPLTHTLCDLLTENDSAGGNPINGNMAAEHFGQRADLKPGVALFTSLAFALQRIVKDVNPTNQIPDHIVTTLTDVPLYVKESYRANLPLFVKLFDLLAKKGDFLKRLLQKTKIDCKRSFRVAALDADRTIFLAIGTEAATQFTGANVDVDDLTSRNRFISTIDTVVNGCITLSTSASEVLRELGDEPQFMQTSEGSVEMYKMRNGRYPLTPLSSALWFLNQKNTISTPDLALFPTHQAGSNAFKMVYGHRQLLGGNTPFSFERAPGVKVLLEEYNAGASARGRIDSERYLKFAQAATDALRYVEGARAFATYVGTASALATAPLAEDAGGKLTGGILLTTADRQGTAAWAYTKDAGTVVEIVEGSDQDASIAAITGEIAGKNNGSSSRDTERKANLIDMNIVPFNVHAMMRDIPLANLYNYEYTFEQIAASTLGVQVDKANGTWGNIGTTKAAFLKLLFDPYVNVEREQYGDDTSASGTAAFVHRIFRGDNNLGMGRPKFLSDQLFNKALFGSIYHASSDYDEAGPSVGIGRLRGETKHLTDFINGFTNGVVEYRKIINAIHESTTPVTGVAANSLNAALTTLLGLVGNLKALALDSLGNKIGTNVSDIAGDAGTTLYSILIDTIHNKINPYVANINSFTFLANREDLGVANKTIITDAAAVFTGASYNAVNVNDHASMAGTAAQKLTAFNTWHEAMKANAAALDALVGQKIMAIATPDTRLGDKNIVYSKVTAEEGSRGQIEHKSIELASVDRKSQLQAVGLARFNTTLVRNLFFVTNIVRLVRLKLNRDLTQSRSVITSSHAAVAPGATEYGTDPYGPDEEYMSKMYNGLSRFDDEDNIASFGN